MKITEIYIESYGSLKDRKIPFSDSINIIEGENESGKTTLMEFIAFMLYGGDSNSHKIKMTAGRCGGSMEIISEKHGKLRIQRYADVSGKKYTDSVEVYTLPSIKKLSINGSVGEFLLGINKRFFQSTAFISQKGASDYAPDSINDSIQNILLSASENHNTDKAVKRLDEVRKFFAYKRGRGGVICELEDKISDYNASASENRDRLNQIKEISAEVSAAVDEKKMYELLISSVFIEKNARKSRKMRLAKEELDEVGKTLESKKNAFRDISQKCSDFKKENVSAKLRELDLKIKYEEARVAELERVNASNNAALEELYPEYFPEAEEILIKSVTACNKKARGFFFSALLAGIIAILLTALAFVSTANRMVAVSILLVILALTLFCTSCILFFKRSEALRQTKLRLSKYGYELDVTTEEIRKDFAQKYIRKEDAKRSIALRKKNSDEIDASAKRRAVLEDHIKNLISSVYGNDSSCKNEQNINSAEEYVNSCFVEYEVLRSEISDLEKKCKKISESLSLEKYDPKSESQLDPKFSAYSDAELDDAVQRASALINSLNDKIREKENKLSVLKSRTPSEEYYDNLIRDVSDTLEIRREQLKILTIADGALRQASEKVKSEITPYLIAKGDMIFSEITNGRYTQIGITDNFSPDRVRGSMVLKNTDLSYGTNEALYLSLRSALLLILCKNELPPMMLDETFAHIDDARTLDIIKLLSSSGMQTLIFTCNKREAYLLHQSNLVFSHIRLT